MGAMEETGHHCQLSLQHVCTLDELLSGATMSGRRLSHLKFDPGDPAGWTDKEIMGRGIPSRHSRSEGLRETG
jgi:hypothetical protein